MHPPARHRLAAAFRERPYAVPLGLLLVALAGMFLGRSRSEWDWCYLETTRNLVAGADIYDAPDAGWTYPPFQALFGLPVIGLPKTAQRAAWFAVNAVCLVWLLRSAWRLAGGGPLRLYRDYPEHFALWLGLVVGLCFAFNALAHQQSDVILAALVVGGVAALTDGRGFRAATLFGLAAAMKCTPVLFAPYLVVRGRPLAAAWLVAVAVGVNLAPDLVNRPTRDGTWLGRWAADFLAPMARPDYAPGTWASSILYNQSFVGMANRWTRTTWEPAGKEALVVPVPPTATTGELRGVLLAAALVCGSVALAGIVVARRRGAADRPGHPTVTAWEAGLVIAGMLLFSPMSSPAHFGLLLLPALALARAAVVHRRWWAGPPLACALAAALLTNKDLWGDKVYTIGLWYGAATWATVAALAGSVAALLTSRPEQFPETSRESTPTAARRAA